MTNRVTYGPQDFQKMCRQAERDHESKRLVVLMERVKRQIEERQTRNAKGDGPKHAVTAINSDSGMHRLPSRSVPLER
jgi:hypothetical protein